MTMIAFKLFRLREDGSLGPLFINKKQKLYVGKTYNAEVHQTTGFKLRPGWHCCQEPEAPHLSKKNRVWCKVSVTGCEKHIRPVNQGGIWYTAKKIKILNILAQKDV